MADTGDGGAGATTGRGTYPGFGGTVGRTFSGSEGWWPERAEPPAGAPNIVVMMADDLGFADLGCYGSEIDTPNLDRLAAGGLRYTNFHVAPMCSPTRASLLTGQEHHRAGVGSVAHSDAGFPGYAMELGTNVVTVAELLRDHGYATLMLGKWHLAKDSDCSAAGPTHSWPCQRGFDRFYGILDAFTNLHQPHRLTQDNQAVEVDQYPDDFYLTDDLTDRAISMVRELKASNPAKPFFCYFAHPAVHAPLHAKPDDVAKYRGRYDAGWDALRQERFDRQVAMGLLPEGTELPPRNTEPDHDVRPWDELSAAEQELFARHMEVYAGMVDNIDQNVGRLLAALDELGELDNTLFVFLSDNGASREGEVTGTTSYYVHLLQGDDVEADRARLDLIGGPRTTPHYPRGWAMASGTPWRLYKINTHAGGHSVPFIVSWPEGRRRGQVGEGVRDQYTHVTDVLPTVAELLGIEVPTERAGHAIDPLAGSSFLTTMADADAPSTHREQVFEMNGHRGFYRDGWEAVTLHLPMTPFADGEWELYHVAQDRTELRDLAADEPERLAELVDAWEAAAWENRIYPLDDGTALKYLLRPPRSAVFAEPVTIRPGTPTLERWRSVQLLWFRSVEIAVDLGAGYRPGDQGVLVAHGDQGAGYGLHVLDGRLRFVHNDGRGGMRHLDGGPVPDGTTAVGATLDAVGGNVWTVTLSVGGEGRGALEGVPMLFGMAPFEGISVGRDPRSPVDWELNRRFGSFPYTGALASVTYTPGPEAPDAPGTMVEMLREIGRAFE
ncbi:MAG: arylsulfatase [Microthrixaceae bacterium]|nr:arylsulfatase [Microthrixaceae bacterium]